MSKAVSGDPAFIYTLIRIFGLPLGVYWHFPFMILMIMMMIGRDYESQQAINLSKVQLYQ